MILLQLLLLLLLVCKAHKGIQLCILCLTLNALLYALQGFCRHGP